MALVLRDVVQRCLGAGWGFAAIVVGTALSALIAPAAWCWPPALAFLLSELADFARLYAAATAPPGAGRDALAGVGLVVDSRRLPSLAFGSLEFLAGQVVGKVWAVLVSVPLIRLLRRVAPTPA